MQKRDKLTKSFTYQFLYQFVILIIPLVLSPYLTRTLRETALGVYSYVHSIAYYFVLFANLGIMRHGQRMVVQSRDNERELRTKVWSLFVLHIGLSLLALFCYCVGVFIFKSENKDIYLIESCYVLSALFDVTWLFYGLESFRSVVIRNMVIKICQCVAVFVLVQTPDDLWKYAFINSFSILLGQMVLLPKAIKIVSPIRIRLNDVKEHIKPLFVFAIAIVASTLYTTFGMTLLGLMTNKENVAFYDYSNQIINVPKTILSVIGTVMFPRACELAKKCDYTGQKRYMKYSIMFTSLIGFGAMFGLFAVADLFAVIYFGKTFAICGDIMKSLAPIIFIIGLGDVIRTQYMIPNEKDKQFVFCIVLNAVFNLVLSVLLIPRIGIYGAVVGTVSAECLGLLFQIIICKDFLNVQEIVKEILPFVFAGLGMYVVIKIFARFLPASIVGLAMQVGIGLLVYAMLIVIYMMTFRKDIKEVLLKTISRRKR